MSEDHHYLDDYLSEILPALGLDTETYAPYAKGYVRYFILLRMIVYAAAPI